MKVAPKIGHARIRVAKKNFGLFLVSRFSNDFILGVGRFGYFDKLTSMAAGCDEIFFLGRVIDRHRRFFKSRLITVPSP